MIKFDDPNNLICPICESKMSVGKYLDRKCRNKCFVAHVDVSASQVFGVSFGFDDKVHARSYYNVSIFGYDAIIEIIRYWREDYRYLAEILERS